MFSLNAGVFLGGLLLLLGILSSKFSARIGMPVLVLFLAVGMVAGSEGIGGIDFSNYILANNISSVALALILFDGGLRTSLEAVRSTWRPALSLATIGVVLTAVFTGLAAAYVLDVPMLYGMLLGGIVGSTDAAAVFSVLRTGGVKLEPRLKDTLEVESASNDPMAIFLTIGLISIIAGTADSTGSLVFLLVEQFGIGAVGGLAVGIVAVFAINRINLDYPALYPIMVTAFGLLAFGLPAVLGGSGFLAVYVAGIVIGNRIRVFRQGIFLFHDAAAWLGQILLFGMLGLLSFPSQLAGVAVQGLLISVVLIFIARPIAVIISALPFGFNTRAMIFLSWVGLKGAVPITLATFPLMAGVEGSVLLFNVVFFVVLVSAVTQGWSLPFVARWLKLAEPSDPFVPISLEVNALRHVDGEIVEYTVAPSARVAGQALRDLALPDGVVVTLLVRNGEVVMPRGATTLRPGDHVFIAMRTRLKSLIDRLFDPFAETPPLEPGLELSFHARSTVGQLHRFFGIPGPTWSKAPIGSLLTDDPDAPTPMLGPFQVFPGNEIDFVTLRYVPEAYQPSDDELHGLEFPDRPDTPAPASAETSPAESGRGSA
ncbi:MAG TPA: potassium/proton antiporter [Rhodothermales bacterium]